MEDVLEVYTQPYIHKPAVARALIERLEIHHTLVMLLISQDLAQSCIIILHKSHVCCEAKYCAQANLNQLPPVSPWNWEFSEDVARANVGRVQGYKQLQ